MFTFLLYTPNKLENYLNKKKTLVETVKNIRQLNSLLAHSLRVVCFFFNKLRYIIAFKTFKKNF